TDAGLVVKIVMVILAIASIISWTFIFERWAYYAKTRQEMIGFERRFWSGIDVAKFYQEVLAKEDRASGIGKIFAIGYKEFLLLKKHRATHSEEVVKGAQRVMRAEMNRQIEALEQHLPFLATVGSTSPYVGLFGTVWGIMTSFTALSGVAAATIAMVAPGISEALIATAMGLFAAIPAVIAYNRYTSQMERILNRYDSFYEEFSGMMYHDLGER
ncbi:MAG: protein TolQ, partial [Gammaproteobacteria bacterium]|nr:protein TolQ [Gammaproteobacteria bacterium]